jgi:two-component system LytT family sensor kinase
MQWPVRRREPSDFDSQTKLIDTLVTAELSLTEDPSAAVVARYARDLSGADEVWIRPMGEAGIVSAGRRAPTAQAHAAFNELAAHTGMIEVGSGLHAVALEGGAAVLFAFDPAGPDRSALVSVLAAWVELRLGQRSLATESERAASAELRALRAQISPHFIFNAMSAIAALIRIDPERAHGLLIDFADYTRYSLGRRGRYTTLADELRAIEIYLALERARFGARLSVRVTVAPEVLTVPVPFLVLQPLVENAIRHGIEPMPLGGRVTVTAEDSGADVRIVIDDDGAGADPALLEALLDSSTPTGQSDRERIGLRNVDERMRAVYGDAHGLVIDTGPGAGMKITVTIPKYRPDVIV